MAKAQWDMALRPAGERWAVPNDARGIAPLVDRLQALHPTLRVLEAPGGLERAATAAWAAAGLPVVVVHPRPAREVARATGPWAKTEALEARALAHWAAVIRPTPRPRPDAQTHAWRALLGRRQPLMVMRTAAQHRLAGTSGRLQTDMAAPITWRNARLATLDDDLEVAAGAPRVGAAHAAADRGLGRRGAPAWRQWDPAGPTHHVGRSRARAHRVRPGDPRGHALQPAEQSL